MYKAKFAENQVACGGGGDINVAQNDLKRIFVLKILKSYEILKIGFFLTVHEQPDRQTPK